jgi:flavin reductase (DIM6/NTAB) family NADH-FMN oxidoreductase RutF
LTGTRALRTLASWTLADSLLAICFSPASWCRARCLGTTLSPGGGVNAPFSAFTFVSNKPPMIGINVGRKGQRKDITPSTTGEFAVTSPIYIHDRAAALARSSTRRR